MSDVRPKFLRMRILHTSDWHLGRSLHQHDLHGAQVDALAQIVTIAEAERVDVTIIAGDIFDRAVPPVEAVTLFVETIGQLAQTSTVVVTSGNHDSAIRLGYGSELFRDGIHVITAAEKVGEGIDVCSDDIRLRIYPIPFLVPDHAREVLKVGDEPLERSHQGVIEAAVARITGNIATEPTPPDVTVVVAHAFVTGGRPSDSERDISVGGIDDVNSVVFAGVDYVALGHLHGPQDVRGPEGTRIRYSGSPLRYSFSEAGQEKTITLVDVDKSGVIEVRPIPINQPRPMAVVTGRLTDILSDENRAAHSASWVQAVVTDDSRPTDLVQEVHAAYPYALSILHRPENPAKAAGLSSEALARMTPVEVATNFISDVTNRSATEEEVGLLVNAYEAART